MRRRPMQNGGGTGGGYNNQHKRPRYTQVGGDNRGGQHRHQGPRKNYTANREKYLAQARDALASGDRVLAENYLQHADHCYRMMMEEGFRPNANPAPAQPGDEAQAQAPAPQEEIISSHSGQLPAFLTAAAPAPAAPPAQDWEERDSQ